MKMKSLILWGACWFAVAFSPVAAQTTDPAVVVVQTSYIRGETRVVIAYGGEKTEVVTFKDTFSQRDQQQGGGAEAVGFQKLFAKLYREGYSLKSTFGPGTGTSSTLVFVK